MDELSTQELWILATARLHEARHARNPRYIGWTGADVQARPTELGSLVDKGQIRVTQTATRPDRRSYRLVLSS